MSLRHATPLTLTLQPINVNVRGDQTFMNENETCRKNQIENEILIPQNVTNPMPIEN